MAIDAAMATGLQGLVSSQQQINRAAGEIAAAGQIQTVQSAPTQPQSSESTAVAQTQTLAEPLLTLRSEEVVFNASARVVDVAEETLGTLIDTRA